MENGGDKAVQALQRTVSEVQALLERNQMLIQEIGQNHAARDADRLNRNVALIHELNTNINRVSSHYSDFSFSFLRSLDAAEPAKKRQPFPVEEKDRQPRHGVDS